MTTLREAAQQALAALDEAKNYTNCKAFSPTLTWECEEAITALRAALAEPTVPSDCADSHQPLNLNDPAVQKRLAAQWGYVKAGNDA